MAAATIELPVIGKVPRTAAIAVGAGAAGFVAYSWWRGGSTPEEAPGLQAEGPYDSQGYPLDVGTVPDYRPPTVVNGNVNVDGTTGFATNAEWTQAALDVIQRYGTYDTTAALSALGKYLARQPLTAAEIDFVNQAIAGAGPPPVGGPYTIVPVGPPPAAVGLPAPGGLAFDPAVGGITFRWAAVPGATGYDVELVAGVATVVKSAVVNGTSWSVTGLRSDIAAPYRLDIWARNSAGGRGAKATIVGRTAPRASGGSTPAGPTSSGGRPGAVPGLTVVAKSKTSIHFRWGAIPGTGSARVKGSGHKRLPDRTINGREFVWQGLSPGQLYRFYVAGQNAKGFGPWASIVAQTAK